MPHDIFISYCSEDEPIATQVRGALEDNGYKCWFAPKSIKGGDAWTNSIVDGVAAARLVVVLVSAAALKSRHVQRELQLADERSIQVLPVRIEPVPAASQPYSLTGVQQIDYDPRALVEAVDAKLKRKRRGPINVPAEAQAGAEDTAEIGYAIQRLYLVQNPRGPLHFVRECPSVIRAAFTIKEVAPNGDLLQLALEFGKAPCLSCLRTIRENAKPNATLVFATDDFELYTDHAVKFADEFDVPLHAIRNIAPTRVPAITGPTLKFQLDEGHFEVTFRDANERDAALDILDGLCRA